MSNYFLTYLFQNSRIIELFFEFFIKYFNLILYEKSNTNLARKTKSIFSITIDIYKATFNLIAKR
jgi:hypothetical protein